MHPGGAFLVHLGMLLNQTSDEGGAHTEDALGSLVCVSPRPWGRPASTRPPGWASHALELGMDRAGGLPPPAPL